MVFNVLSFLCIDIVVMGILFIGVIVWLFDFVMWWVEWWVVLWKGRG